METFSCQCLQFPKFNDGMNDSFPSKSSHMFKVKERSTILRWIVLLMYMLIYVLLTLCLEYILCIYIYTL